MPFDHDFCSNFLKIVILKELRVSIDRFPSNSPLLKSFISLFARRFVYSSKVESWNVPLMSSHRHSIYAIEIINQGSNRIRYSGIALIFQINMWNSTCLKFPIFTIWFFFSHLCKYNEMIKSSSTYPICAYITWKA